MKIARISKHKMIPPIGVGGTRRVIAQLTALQAATCGDDITLYASADSEIIKYTQTIANDLGLQSQLSEDGSSISIRNQDDMWGSVTLRTTGEPHTKDREATRRLFDLLREDELHNPSDIVHLHGRTYLNELAEAGWDNVVIHLHTGIQDRDLGVAHPVIALSQSHANDLAQLPGMEILGIAHHGIYPEGWQLNQKSCGYLLNIGRLVERKGTHRAISIAKRSGKPLIISGPTYVNTSFGSKGYFFNEFFNEKIKPYISVYDETLPDRMAGKSPTEVKEMIADIEKRLRLQHPDSAEPAVIFVGEVNDEQKRRLYGNADATLMPISLPEPFGLVMIESMATGTPVIGYTQLGNIKTGSVDEVIDEGVTGFKVSGSTEDEAITNAVAAVNRIGELNRTTVRKIFDAKWSARHEVATIKVLFEKFIRNKALEKPGPYQTSPTVP